jgi:hypothetical protein
MLTLKGLAWAFVFSIPFWLCFAAAAYLIWFA